MTDFTQQLKNLDGELATQREKSTDDKGKPKIKEFPLTILRCAKFALLDVAEFRDGADNELFTGNGHQERWHLWNKININPTKVELNDRERELFSILLPLRFDVVCVGQIMDLLDK